MKSKKQTKLEVVNMLKEDIILESIIIKDKEDLKNKLQQGLDDIKLNKTYSLDEVFKHIDNL